MSLWTSLSEYFLPIKRLKIKVSNVEVAQSKCNLLNVKDGSFGVRSSLVLGCVSH